MCSLCPCHRIQRGSNADPTDLAQDSSALDCGDNYYKNLAVECSRTHVCIDMFLFPHAYVDVATLSTCPARPPLLLLWSS